MKTFVISLVILALILGGGAFYTISLDRICDEIAGHTDAIGAALAKGDLEGAREQTRQLERVWGEKKGVLTALVDHSYLSAIDVSVAELTENMNYEELSQASEKNAKIKTQVKDIAQNEHLHFENIL